ncbi:hypothetical protein, partial [Lutibacter sp.]|uniref:beta strand repeat-containing protein n=1 Tax=Lutibacter sp. TaxID=1925666 RepID=UPI0025BB35DB
VSANTDVAANTAKTGITTQQANDITANNAKTGITPAQAAIIAATSGTNTGDQDISGIATNATDISTLQSEQTTQNTAIALNTAKVSDVNHVTSSTTDNLTEGTTNLYYTEARVSANTDVAANTAKTGITTQQANDITANNAKTGITPAQAAIIAATSGTNTGDQDITGIVTNATDISTLQTEQTTQNTAIALNTAKITNATHTGDVTGATVLTIGDGKVTDAKIVAVAASKLTGAVAIANGGTGATTKVAGFDALSPMTAVGDIIYGGTNGTGTTLVKGTANQVLTINAGATAPEWKTPTAGVTNINGLSDGKTTSSSVFLGYRSGSADNLVSTNENTGLGIDALRTNDTGKKNTAIGYRTLYANSSGASAGDYNTAVGSSSLIANTSGGYNTALGAWSLKANIIGTNNTALGALALSRATGSSNVAIGSNAMYNNVTGVGNIAIGNSAGYNETGSNKLYIDNSNTTTPLIYGDFAANLLRVNGDLEVSGTVKIEGGIPGVGKVLTSDATGLASWATAAAGATKIDDLSDARSFNNSSIVLGQNSAPSNIASSNTIIGVSAMLNSTGQGNTAVGYSTGNALTTGTGNVFLGNSAGFGETGSNKLYISNGPGSDLIYGEFDTGLLRFNTSNVEIYGNVKLFGGSPGVGKVLTSDANGLASWETNAVASIDGLSDGKNDGSSIFLGGGGNNDDGGNVNTAVGKSALASVTSGISNVAIGYSASGGTTTGSSNVAIGHFANLLNNSGSQNVVIGDEAGKSLGGGSGNILIGYQAGLNETVSNKLYIENSNSTTPLIYGEFDTNLVTINGALNLKNGTSAGNLSIYEASGSGTNKVTIQTPALAADYTLMLPVDDGTLDQVLKTDGNGALSWTTPVSSNSNIFSLPVAMNLTVSSSDKYVICEVDGISITLPTAVGIAGKEYIIKNIAATNVTITTTSSQLIIQDAATKTTTATLGVTAQNNWIKVISDGTNWISFRALY